MWPEWWHNKLIFVKSESISPQNIEAGAFDLGFKDAENASRYANATTDDNFIEELTKIREKLNNAVQAS